MSANLAPLEISWPTLSHYSSAPLHVVHSTLNWPASDGYVSAHDKPKGLWVSIDGEDDWPAWCRAEQFGMACLAVRHVVMLNNPDSLLWLTTPEDLDHFTDEWGIDAKYNMRAIEWWRVAQKYPGIMITPYCWQRRLDLFWYYGWDCASGCIWDSEAVASIEVSP